jgi:hypothetical protein
MIPSKQLQNTLPLYSLTSSPSYQSGNEYSLNPPSYQSGNEYYINCCLENENMNIDFIIFVITIFLTLYLFKKVKDKNVNFIQHIY